jgi:hypothetical protein
MSEHLLHSPQVGPVFHKMGGEGMTYGMGRYSLGNLDLVDHPVKDYANTPSGQSLAPVVEKKRSRLDAGILVPLSKMGSGLLKILAKNGYGN